jgi:hypothetical protein
LLASTIAAGFFAVGVRFALEESAKSRSDAMLAEVEALRIGESSSADVEKLVRRNGRSDAKPLATCEGGSGCYVLTTGLPIRLNQFLGRHVFLQRLTGLSPWFVEAVLETTGDKLSGVRVHVGANAGNFPLGVLMKETVNAGDKSRANFEVAYYLLRNYTSPPSPEIRVNLTSKASLEERQSSFDIDLACAVSFSGCRRVCELAPAAWKRLLGTPAGNGVPIPAEDAADPRCSRE